MRLSTILSMATTFACIGIVLISIFVLLFMIGYVLIYKKWMKGQKKLSLRRLLWWCVFLCYCFVVIAATLLARGVSTMPERVYPLFYSYREAWISWSEASWRNIIFNYCMFLPLGFLLPLGFQRFRRGLPVFLTGFGFSFLIEITQLITRRGMFEPDDLLGNTVGALIGLGMFLFMEDVVKRIKKKPHPGIKKVLAAQLPLFLTILAFTIILIKYDSKELGNHPDVPLDRPSKKQLSINAALSFSDETAPSKMIWKSMLLTAAQAAEEAERIFSSLGTAVDKERTRDFDGEAFFYSEDGTYSLILSYQGGTYSLTNYDIAFPKESQGGSKPKPVTNAGSEEILSALKALYPDLREVALSETLLADSSASGGSAAPATGDPAVPASASPASGIAFTEKGNGWYRLALDAFESDGKYLTGYVECRYFGEAGIGNLVSQLKECIPYKERPVISKKTAYEMLANGNFNYYANDGSSSLELWLDDCELTYVVDSKGFLQPTYEFTGTMNGTPSSIRIPALK